MVSKLSTILGNDDEKMLTQTTPHPSEPNAEKLAYFAEASRMSAERSFVKLQANYGFVKISDLENV
jgi:hypothetical protein